MSLTKVSGSILKDPLNLGEVSIGGTLTYQDVTNVDSIGIVTARTDINLGDSIIHIDDTNTKIRFPADDTITAETSGTERVRIDSSGRVLIGTTTEGFAEADDLTINSADHGGITIRTPTNKEGNIAFSDTTSGTGEYSGLIRYRHSQNDLGLWTNSLLRLLIDSNGRVGINESTPLGKLHVKSSESGATVGASADELVLESSANTGMSILSGTSNEGAINFGDSGANNVGKIVYMHNGDYMYFKTNAVERLRIKSDGKIDVGGTENGYKFNIIDESNRTTTAETALLLYAKHDGSGTTGAGFGTGIRFWGDRASGNVEQNMGRIMCTAEVNSGTTLSGALSFDTSVAGSLSERLRITSGGSVNIGDNFGQTTYKTQIEATDQNVLRLVTDSDNADGVELVLRKDSASPADNDNIGNIYFQGNDDSGAATFFASMEAYSDDVSNNSENGYIRFRTRNDGTMAERLRINSNGKLKLSNTITSSVQSHFEIGDTQGSFDFELSDASGGSDFIRHVKKRFVGKDTYGLTITSRSTLSGSYTKAGEASIKFYYPSAGGGAQAGGQLEFWTNQNGYAGTTEAKRMQISNSGNIGAPNGNNIYNASDERLKENMVELTNGLDKIKKLKPISFNWKDGWDECMSGKKEYGFGAQTTQVVDEMLVEPFGTEDTLLNGEVITNPLRVNEKYITPLLVKAIQEQQEQIETLKAEVAALKSS